MNSCSGISVSSDLGFLAAGGSTGGAGWIKLGLPSPGGRKLVVGMKFGIPGVGNRERGIFCNYKNDKWTPLKILITNTCNWI